ncbi:MAG TPA: HD domain-containing phosphohydrolase [bacterium]|nr:HD domain-containing phosphohydrolase [bacterium]
MNPQPRKVKAAELAPGMTLHGVTGFSAEYGYLDSTLIAFLRERFPGAACDVLRKGARQQLTVEALAPLDELRGLTPVPDTAGLAPLDAPAAQVLRERGLREFLVTGEGTPTAEPPSAPAAAASTGAGQAPAAVSGGQAARRERVTQARAFLEQVGLGAERREHASELVQDLFSQGRAGKYTTKPAEQAVDEIVSQGLSGAMGAIAGLKGSDQTYAHCVDTSVIFQEAYADILRHQGTEITEDVVRRTLLAGFCHDIGKSKVPKEILDSTKRFERDSEEMRIMRSHAAYGAEILTDLGMSKATINVAHYHHVKVDTSLPASYPEQARWEDVLPITRLAAVVDVYQALIGKRSYKKNWVPGKAVEYLKGLRDKEFDPQMLDYFLRVIGLYPIGSLVRLSTGEKAFVVSIGDDVLDRPVVAVVENAQGELLRQHPLIDLMVTPDLSVEEVVDHYEHYSESEDQAFRIFSSLNVT